MKYFIITVDTEGDNLWNYRQGDVVTTENSAYIPRFQALCEKYAFPPVYLTNYEMLCDDSYVSFVREKHNNHLCEVGLHLHAWNNPPSYDLEQIFSGNPYLIEYPSDVMRAKFASLHNFFYNKMGFMPTSHRAGRWAMNSDYFKLLEEHNVNVDCSVTPHIDWSRNVGATRGGSNYSDSPETPHWIGDVLEIPPTIRISRYHLGGSLMHKAKVLLCGEALTFRLANSSVVQQKRLIDTVYKETSVDYLEFMLHSSELMPGGSPYFEDESSIEQMYSDLEEIFSYVKSLGYTGITLTEYYNKVR